MLESVRARRFDKARFKAGSLDYIEGYTHAPYDPAKPEGKIFRGSLEQANFTDWVKKEWPPASATSIPEDGQPSSERPGSFRLLIVGSKEGDLEMLKSSLLDVEQYWDVPAGELLRSLTYTTGIQTCDFPATGDTMIRLTVSHKTLLGSSGALALSYNKAKMQSTAILVQYVDTDPAYAKNIYDEMLEDVYDFIDSLSDAWAHWTMLPIMYAHLYHTVQIERLDFRGDDIKDLEKRLGVIESRADVMLPGSLGEQWPEHVDFKTLIVDIYYCQKRLLFYRRDIAANRYSLDLIIKMHKDARTQLTGYDKMQQSIISDHLAHVDALCLGCTADLDSLISNLDLLGSLAYNAINQRDSLVAQRFSRTAQEQTDLASKNAELNIKIATSTKEDSISMLTFTFITALFLPGTFLSSFLSMSMFDWNTGGGSSSSSSSGGGGQANQANQTDQVELSKYFWVFWAIDIPLTLIVLTFWWLYWNWARKSWSKQMVQRQETLDRIGDGSRYIAPAIRPLQRKQTSDTMEAAMRRSTGSRSSRSVRSLQSISSS